MTKSQPRDERETRWKIPRKRKSDKNQRKNGINGLMRELPTIETGARIYRIVKGN